MACDEPGYLLKEKKSPQLKKTDSTKKESALRLSTTPRKKRVKHRRKEEGGSSTRRRRRKKAQQVRRLIRVIRAGCRENYKVLKEKQERSPPIDISMKEPRTHRGNPTNRGVGVSPFRENQSKRNTGAGHKHLAKE